MMKAKYSVFWVMCGSLASMAVAVISLEQVQAQVSVTSNQLGLEEGTLKKLITHMEDSVSTGGRILEEGGPRRWDFSTGPSDDTLRTEIILSADSGHGEFFPNAHLAEKARFDSGGAPAFTFYNLTGAGRELHGFYSEEANPDFPQVVFEPPFVDYVAVMQFGDDWSSTTMNETRVTVTGAGQFDVKVETTTTSEVDAFGTMLLPGDLGETEVLRINELTAADSVADVGGTPVPLGTIYVRSYYWISPHLGIVAQLTSPASTEEPDDNFETAARFLRLSERVNPSRSVTGLQIRNAGEDVILTWDDGADGEEFDVQSSADLRDWQLVETTDDVRFQARREERQVFYRVERR